MRSATAVVALSGLTLVAAQNATQFTIDVTSVSETERNQWCIAQENTCGELCDNDPIGNSCDITTLDTYCTCQNGSAPGLQYYVSTMDYYTCQEAFSECNTENVGNAKGQANCTTTIQDNCGTLDPASYSASGSSSSSSSASASGTASATSSASATAASTATSTAGAVPTHIQHIGTGAAAAAIGFFAYML
ncbi:hypothetical protein N0V82_000476 [Gnomoniopsis sp. IMI 355080]|nr:hypothetical protein N0V82_000476 [Gnomoniopsis sp. IMI 355080]